MYGSVVEYKSDPPRPYPLPSGNEAQLVDVDSQFYNNFTRICGKAADEMLAMNPADSPRLCCSSDQLQTLEKGMFAPQQLLGSCPAAYHNFVNFFCHFTCNPNQAQHLVVTDTRFLNTTLDGQTEVVTGLDYYVTKHYVDEFFNSTKEV